jgi:hypothetical protein
VYVPTRPMTSLFSEVIFVTNEKTTVWSKKKIISPKIKKAKIAFPHF